MTSLRPLVLASLFAVAVTGCDEGTPSSNPSMTPIGPAGPGSAFTGSGTRLGPLPAGSLADPATSPYQEIYENGLTAYAGTAAVTPTEVKEPLLYPNISVYKFESEGRGPICMRGADYFVETRDGSSEDLMVFLEGGGVCLDELCAATSSPMLSLRLLTAGDAISLGGVLDKSDDRNPLRNFDLVHVPYCDGSIFLGDVDRTLSDGNPWNGPNDVAYQRGLENLTAAFEVAKRRYPNPRRVVLAGSSGGGYGVLVGVAMARYYYPTAPLLVVADSGAPILTSEDPGFLGRITDEVHARHLVPDSCSGCLDRGHATKLIAWALERDAGLTVAYMGHARDHVIGEFFMGSTPEQFEASVVRETGMLRTAFPTRTVRFIAPGRRHMFLIDGAKLPIFVQHSFLGLFGTQVFTGEDIDAAELSTWTLGGLTETSRDVQGRDITGYQWLDTVVNRFADARDAVQTGP